MQNTCSAQHTFTFLTLIIFVILSGNRNLDNCCIKRKLRIKCISMMFHIKYDSVSYDLWYGYMSMYLDAHVYTFVTSSHSYKLRIELLWYIASRNFIVRVVSRVISDKLLYYAHHRDLAFLGARYAFLMCLCPIPVRRSCSYRYVRDVELLTIVRVMWKLILICAAALGIRYC